MSHRFSLRQLEYAVALAETLNFRKAAEQCHVSQPSLSAQLAQLEEAIGMQLFERDRRHVLVTPLGAEVIARARVLLRCADDVEMAARRAADPFTGTMRVGIIPTVSPYLLPRIAPVLRRQYPRLHLQWTECPAAASSSFSRRLLPATCGTWRGWISRGRIGWRRVRGGRGARKRRSRTEVC